ncbi:hypothetical protein Leryth_024095 [Lithospermum erythrorhizon]|nr:hypothetical protein Leryth_024095 [Lithospermum erythrorhizon]
MGVSLMESMAIASGRASRVPYISSSSLRRQLPTNCYSFCPIRMSNLHLKKRAVFAFSADSKPSDIQAEEGNDVKDKAEESQEAWKQTLDSFKEQAIKMQSLSQEAYERYSEKAAVILKDASERLKVQAEKARQDLTVIAKEVSEESKEYLAGAAENSPEPVKDIVETFASADEIKEPSAVRDFYLGIPYGALLSAGGFSSFMLTGSISAIRFGVILGGALLALSISSLRSWKKGESSSVALKGQAVIAAILFTRELRMLFVRPFILNLFSILLSGTMAAFYAYRILNDDGHLKESAEPES